MDTLAHVRYRHFMHLTLRARALGPLVHVDWTVPPGVSAIVGPNRIGKSTLLRLPEFLTLAFSGGLNQAVQQVFEGTAFVRNLVAPPGTKTSVGATLGDLVWDLDLAIQGASVAPFCAERITFPGGQRVTREAGEPLVDGAGTRVNVGPATILRHFYDRASERSSGLLDIFDEDPEHVLVRWTQALADGSFGLNDEQATLAVVSLFKLATFHSYRTYEYQIPHLLRYGSIHSAEKTLLPTGENLFPLLRNWRDSSETEGRFEFVRAALSEAFRHVGKLEFEAAGQTVTMAIHDTRLKKKVPIARESTGLITALHQLCAIASCPRGGMVTIDEPETSLHPHAIKVLVDAARRWTRDNNARVVFATQSETVLDQFRDEPEKVFVLEPNQETSPQPLTALFDRAWLSQFSLGDLFAHLEFGSSPELRPG